MKIDTPQPRREVFPALKKFLKSRFRYFILLVLLAVTFFAGLYSYKRVYLPALGLVKELIAGSKAVPEAVKEVEKNVTNEIRMYLENGLPTLYIDLPFEGYQKLLNKRQEAIEIGVLNTTDADFVDAQVHLTGGPNLEAKLRLKGDWTDHLQGDKWSFRIHLKEDGEILHTRQFSIQSPHTRNFLYEWAFHQNLVQEGILSPRYEFINVLLNGKLLGIYALEENFAPELIESQGRRQGVIIRFNEDLMWQNFSTFWAQDVANEGQFMITNLWNSEITPFQESRIAENPVLKAEAEAAIGLLTAYRNGERTAAQTFDIDLVGRYFALSDLWSVCHGLAWHNLRFYYNPVTARLEPVPYDNEPNNWCSNRDSLAAEFAKSPLFNDPDVRVSYVRNLERLTQSDYVQNLKKALTPAHDHLRDGLQVEFSENVTVDWEELEYRRKMLSLELQPAVPVRGFYQASSLEPGAANPPTLTLEVGNILLLPVEVVGVEINGKRAATSPTPVALAPVINLTSQVFQPVKISYRLENNAGLDQPDPKVEVVVRTVGIEREYRVALRGGRNPESVKTGPAPVQPSLVQVLQQHPFLNKTPDSQLLTVKPGIWDVQGDLTLPSGVQLIIPAGTVLRFEPSAILYTTAALSLLGESNAPVVLTAQQDTWGGIVVMSSAQGSEWRYAAVEKTGGIDRSGWTLTGGITFFQSDILLDHALIGRNRTEDAINVIHGQFTFRDSEFSTTFADAFDSDFSTGIISNCTFHDIAGDAVDVSGTSAVIYDTRMERIGDKGVSVGENSTVTIDGVSIDTVGIGVASKDLSRVTLSDSTIRKASFAALAAYIKKPVYGPASIETTNLTILDTIKEAVAQTGSTILLRGKPVQPVDLDVDLLYQQGILGN